MFGSKSVVRWSLLITACWSGPVMAQVTAGDTPAEEIVVTARKQAESLVRVPVAVTAIGKLQLERAGATDLGRIAELAPQLSATRTNSGTGATFVIRGIGSPSLDAGLEQSVLVDIDGVQVGRGRVVTQGLFDLQQVEVLKGPQALFFGKNSPAGVISVKSAGPGDRLEGYVRAGYEFKANERFAEAAIGGPVTSTLGVRLALRADKTRGWIRNVAQGGPDPFYPGFVLPGAPNRFSPGSTELVGRLTVAWKPDSNFNATLKVLGSRRRDNGDAGQVEAFCGPGQARITAYGVPDPSSDCRLNDRKSAGALPAPLAANLPHGRDGGFYTRGHTWLTSLSANYEFGDLTLSSTTGYYYYKIVPQDNFDDTTYAVIFGNNPERNKSFTQELRLTSSFDGPVNFTLGGFYENTKRDLEANTIIAPLPADSATGNLYSLTRLGADRNKAYSVFGQIRWNILSNVELAGGARYTSETKRTALVNEYLHEALAPAFYPQGTVLSGRFKDSNVSPEVTLSWHPTPDSTLYGAYKTGYKSGGFANPTVLTPSATMVAGAPGSLQFSSEKATGGEIGYKAELLNRALRVELTAFRYDYDDLQVVSFDAPTFSFNIGNAAKARTQGVEGALSWRPTQALSLQSSFGYAKANYISFPGAPCTASATAANPTCVQDLGGRPLPRAPRWSATAGASYELPVTDVLSIGLNASLKYSGSYFAQENQDPNTHQGSFVTLDAGARLYSGDNNGWELAFIGRNLTNKRPLLFANDKAVGLPEQFEGVRQRPREVWLQGTYRF